MTQTNHQATDLFETAMTAFANNNHERSIELFSRIIDDDGDNILARVSRGAAYLKKDMLDSAWNDFNYAITINPDYARAYHMRGLVSEKKGDDEAALGDFDRAIELDPEYGAAYYSRATLHSKLSNAEKAQEDIQMVTQLSNIAMASFMNENNVWRTEHMRVEDYLETELDR